MLTVEDAVGPRGRVELMGNGAVGSRDGVVILTVKGAVGPTGIVELKKLDGAVGPVTIPDNVEFGKRPVAKGGLMVLFAKPVVRVIEGAPVPGNEVVLKMLGEVRNPVLPGIVTLRLLVGVPVGPGNVILKLLGSIPVDPGKV